MTRPNLTQKAIALVLQERMQEAGLRLMPTAWPMMTEKEKQVYLDRWTPIIVAAFPEYAEVTP